MEADYEKFFNSKQFAVVGASNNKNKYGNKVLRCYQSQHLSVFPVNPHEDMIEGIKSYKSVLDLPNEVKSISIITPPNVTEQIIAEAIQKGIKNIWIQPGAESHNAMSLAKKSNMNLIAHGPCILVYFRFNHLSA